MRMKKCILQAVKDIRNDQENYDAFRQGHKDRDKKQTCED